MTLGRSQVTSTVVELMTEAEIFWGGLGAIHKIRFLYHMHVHKWIYTCLQYM